MKKFGFLVLALSVLSLQLMASEVDLKKSMVNWKGTKVTGEHHGTIALKKAEVKMEGDKLQKANFVVDMDSIVAEGFSDDGWKNKFLKHIKSEDFFEVQKYPTATLVVKKVDGNKVTADLTIKGKTNPVSFEYKKDGEGYLGEFTFDRTKFDMIYGSGDFFKGLGDKVIHNDVKLSFKVVLKK